jgi:hypothetical protein
MFAVSSVSGTTFRRISRASTHPADVWPTCVRHLGVKTVPNDTRNGAYRKRVGATAEQRPPAGRQRRAARRRPYWHAHLEKEPPDRGGSESGHVRRSGHLGLLLKTVIQSQRNPRSLPFH